MSHAYDIDLDTAAKADDRADAMLRGYEVESEKGELTVPLNPAQELFDVISIENSLWAVGDAERRCIALKRVFSPQGGEYSLICVLGSP